VGDPVSVVLAAVMAAVTLYCLLRLVLPRLGDPLHRPDIDVGHVLMGAAMGAMLLWPVRRAPALVALGLFGLGAGWCCYRLLRRTSRGLYARLGLGCVAMVAMLIPSASATTDPAQASSQGASEAMGGMADMPAMPSPTDPAAMGMDMVTMPGWAAALLVSVMGVVAMVGLHAARTAGAPVSLRLQACCETAMALAMAYMALTMMA
jgi:hypothetical protein